MNHIIKSYRSNYFSILIFISDDLPTRKKYVLWHDLCAHGCSPLVRWFHVCRRYGNLECLNELIEGQRVSSFPNQNNGRKSCWMTLFLCHKEVPECLALLVTATPVLYNWTIWAIQYSALYTSKAMLISGAVTLEEIILWICSSQSVGSCHSEPIQAIGNCNAYEMWRRSVAIQYNGPFELHCLSIVQTKSLNAMQRFQRSASIT